MRKILLGTTGVVAAALIGMGAAQAQEAPTVRVGGYMLTTMNFVNDNADTNQVSSNSRTSNAASTDFRNEFEFSIFVTGKAANGLSYGAVMEVQNDAVFNSVMDIDEAYVFVSSPTLGTIRFGEEDSAASIMQVRAPTISGFGSDGDFDDNLRSGGPSILTGINDSNDATKIVYLSPQFAGFDFGVSYAPNAGEGERNTTLAFTTAGTAIDTNNLQRDRATIENEISAAIRYRGTFGGVGIAAAAGYMQADPSFANQVAAASHDNLQVYTVGLNLSAFGLTVGGEYTWGRFGGTGRTTIASTRDDSTTYVLGATYVTGAISLGAFYGAAEQDRGGASGKREQTGWGIGAAYALAPGLELIANYTQLEDKNIGTAVGNVAVGGTRDVNVFFVGTRLAF